MSLLDVNAPSRFPDFTDPATFEQGEQQVKKHSHITNFLLQLLGAAQKNFLLLYNIAVLYYQTQQYGHAARFLILFGTL